MWVLVFISVVNSIPAAITMGEFESMYDCFGARELQLAKLKAWDGIPPINTQLVCVRTE